MSAPKSVLITGCSDGGIGSALARTFADRGFHVFATARDTSRASKLRDVSNVTLLTLDVTKQQDIDDAVAAVKMQTSGKLDVLVNNAGRNHFMPVLDEDVSKVKEVFEVNYWGPIKVTQAFAPLLKDARGTLVFITSISGYVNTPFMGTYAASKRSLEITAETLRLELAPFGMPVMSIVTGAVQSQGQTYFGDWALPQNSLYKSIEDTIAARARGRDALQRQDTMEYAGQVVDRIAEGKAGKYWCGGFADVVEGLTKGNTAQDVLDGIASMGTDLEKLGDGDAKGE
ncbi:1-acyl dihydroxyacetone phosphate reductase [Massariosphaeria phaeospora]|uniref:1-acyl dihydroxyacetone phosphate reductase n=1 Tax=Massariosphaeria phaeospora TaxID=100035 RepID=A0A7C8HZN2_9PLEO|nr:1-acyl dihydroxyacetone phosphate reductase [Massariosphaeria phaeospora]